MSTTKRITELDEQSVPLYADDLAVVVTDVGGTPTTKKTALGTLRRFMLGIASVGTLVFPEQNQTLGTAVTGTDAASADVTISVAPGTGAGGPAAYIVKVPVRVGGATDAQTLTEALRVQEVANASGREVALWNPSGSVMAGLPTNTAAALLTASDSGRFGNRLVMIRAAATPVFGMGRVNTSLSAPSAVLSGDRIGTFSLRGYDSAGSFAEAATVEIIARENFTGTALGSLWRWRATDTGTATVKTLFDARGGGSNIAELVSGQPTLRLIPGATQFAIRDSGNTADTFTVNAAGTAITAPLATSFVVGADPGGAQVLRVGGQARVEALALSTTGGIYRTSTTSVNIIAGGDSVSAGGNVRLLGQSHATQANDIEFRSGSTVRGWWDDSAALWTFGGTLKYGDDATGTNVAATPALFRAPGSTGNATPAGYKWQISVAGSSGATVQSSYIDAMTLAYESSGLARLTVVGYFNAANGYMLAGTQVVGARQSGVADATDATDVITRFNELLARLRPAGHGLIDN